MNLDVVALAFIVGPEDDGPTNALEEEPCYTEYDLEIAKQEKMSEGTPSDHHWGIKAGHHKENNDG